MPTDFEKMYPTQQALLRLTRDITLAEELETNKNTNKIDTSQLDSWKKIVQKKTRPKSLRKNRKKRRNRDISKIKCLPNRTIKEI